METARRFPVRLIESGPAGGAILARHVAARGGYDRAISFDMGGTTAKITLIDDFTPQQSRHFEVARAYRFAKGQELTASMGERDYFVCERCEEVRAADPRALEPVRQAIARAFGWRVRFNHFPIAGLCPRCAEEADRSGYGS